MSGELRIRQEHPDDRAALIAIYARAKLDELAHEPVVPALVPLPQDRARLATLDASEVFVACAAFVHRFRGM